LARRPSKAWRGAELTKAEVAYALSPEAEAEFAAHLQTADQHLSSSLDLHGASLSRAACEIEELRNRVEQVHGFAIIEPVAALRTPAHRRAVLWLIGCLLGEPIEQSREGIKIVQVYDRDRTRRMEDGARYHQTRQGGSIHTDNVNRPETWDYLLMACLFPAMIGGESIVVSGLSVYDFLLQRAPRALDVLAEDFWWERRGFSDEFFRTPVLFFDQDGEPRFRYLREYLESAHRRTGDPLSDEQLWALDSLESALELSELQFRCKLMPGEILVLDDLQMFHGRTSFSDFFEAVPYEAGSFDADQPFRRCFDRLWISKRAA
jgi:Taurine catabolism dioxygenase TauD, TfdA family